VSDFSSSDVALQLSAARGLTGWNSNIFASAHRTEEVSADWNASDQSELSQPRCTYARKFG